MQTPLLRAVQVGLPRTYGPEGTEPPFDRSWTTGFIKEPVVRPVWVGRFNIEGDGQADLAHHGGPDKAVCAYAADHYDGWRRELGLTDFSFGAFGENFTVERLLESAVCIGDIWRIGDATLQLSQPRQPCWKLARRWRVKMLALQVQRTGRTGWYFRVVQEGLVAPGAALILTERPHPDWTVERANRVMHQDKQNLEAARDLARLPSLSTSWRDTMLRRVEKGISDEVTSRLGDFA